MQIETQRGDRAQKAFVRVVRSGRAIIIHCGIRLVKTTRLALYGALDVALAWRTEYRTITQPVVR